MSRLTAFARRQDCTLRLAPYCNGDSATVVACHLPGGDRGVGLKAPDWWSVHGCAACHDIIDGRNGSHGLDPLEIQRALLRAHFLTMRRCVDAGLITIVEARNGRDRFA